MILLVDLGNSRLKWAALHADELSNRGAVSYAETGLTASLQALWHDIDDVEGVLAASVAGADAETELTGYVSERWHLGVDFLTAQGSCCGVQNAYAEPSGLGADRWAALIGTWNEHGGPACIVDCGTAITIDALSGTGEHLGGLILPGLEMMHDALIKGTAGIGPVAGGSGTLLARSTADGVAGGALYAVASTMDRIAGDLEEELGERPRQLLTGGDAPRLAPLLGPRWEHDPDLVLRGLGTVAMAEA